MTAFYHFKVKHIIKGTPLSKLKVQRRYNILTFHQIFYYHGSTLVYFMIESVLFFFLYGIQDKLGQEWVFLIFMFVSGLFDIIRLYIVPLIILYKSISEFPELWIKFTPKKAEFFFLQQFLTPKRRIHGSQVSMHHENFGGHVDKLTQQNLINHDATTSRIQSIDDRRSVGSSDGEFDNILPCVSSSTPNPKISVDELVGAM